VLAIEKCEDRPRTVGGDIVCWPANYSAGTGRKQTAATLALGVFYVALQQVAIRPEATSHTLKGIGI
jgi:hypothetical protein